MRCEPLYDQIAVVELDPEREIDGVYLPETSKDAMKFGTVVLVGQGYVQEDGSFRSLVLKPGDTVGFGIYAGIPVNVEGTTFLIMREMEALFRMVKDA